ncbi:MAG TPA: hypothetical protein VMR25_21925 [Planctomycetaceae bacterium]|nr:hypothetical protein [Planctomycetaceae bacterium]
MICRTEPFLPYVPSLGQIREQCRQIRREWSTQERASRRADGSQVWRLLVSPHPQFDRKRRFESS